MAQALVIGIAEVAVGLAGLGMMIPGLLPQKPVDPSHTTVVRVGAGMHGLAKDITDSSTAGNFPDVILYDGAGRQVGRNGGKNEHPHVDAGGFKEVQISHDKGMDGVESEYVAIAASGNDAVCINWISMTWPGGEQFGFLGDIGTMCGADWYYSDVLTANYDSSSTETPVLLNRTSNCVWIDGNGSNGLRFQGFGYHVTDFSSSKDVQNDGRAEQYHTKPNTMCSNAPRFKMYEKMHVDTKIPIFWPKLAYNSDNSDADLKVVTNNGGIIPKRRKARNHERAFAPLERSLLENSTILSNGTGAGNTTNPFMYGVLIKSPYEQHNATHLCNADNSKGPDFVSLVEEVFCDMEKKEAWPICSNKVTHGCFDCEVNQMRPGPLGKRTIQGRQIPSKSYTKEVKWGNN